MNIKIGGVPEHFNFPWHYALRKGSFQKNGVMLDWIDFAGGTGSMVQALRNGGLDMAILLTEGAVKEINNNAPFKIVKIYVESPLTWGIHSSSNNDYANISMLYKMKYAISRIGSGSHLMSFVHAKEMKQSLNDHQMIVVNNLDNALKSLEKLETDLFFWEKYTTKPYVDNGQLKRLGEFSSPWPCFVIVAHEDLLLTNEKITQTICHTINDAILELNLQKEQVIYSISDEYKLDFEDATQWLNQTTWSSDNHISIDLIQKVQAYHLELRFTPSLDTHSFFHSNFLN